MKYVLHLVMAFFFLVLTLTAAFAQGDAPTIFKGQGNTTKMVGASVQVPNNQVTKLTSSSVLVETGNNDILMNPSFESVTGYDNWTTTSSGVITTAETITKVIHGKKAVCLTTTANTVSFYQDSTLYASQLDGNQQGTLRGQVFNNTGSTIYMCPRPAGASITSDYNSKCQAFESNNTWTEKELPIALGATSNGVEFKSNGNITATGSNLCFDDVSLKIGSVKATQSFDTTCDTIACATEFSARISAAGVVSAENFDWINGNCSVSSTNQYSCTYTASVFSQIPTCVFTPGSAINNGATVNILSGSTSAIGYQTSRWDAAVVAYDVNITCSRSTTDYTAAITAQKAFQNTKLGSFSSINVDETKIGEVIYSSRANAPTGFISALNVSIGLSGATHNGQDYYKLYEQLWALAGLSTTAGDPYRISSAKGASALADWTALKTITIDYATNEVFVRAKGASRNAGSYQADMVGPHSHSVFFGNNSGGTTGPAASNAITTTNQSANFNTNNNSGTETRPKNVALYAYIRYLPESKFIMGSFNGLEKCADSYECTDTFTARISSTGVVSGENIDWINGNCTVANPNSTCPLKTGLNGAGVSLTNALNCTYTVDDGGSLGTLMTKAANSVTTTSQIGYVTQIAGANTWQAVATNVICQKQGADYIGKTAKAVASDQNVRSIGSVGVDIQSVYFAQASACSTGTCTVNNQIGSKITSVTWQSAGEYRLNGIDGTKYNCNVTTPSPIVGNQDRGNSTSTYARILTRNGAVLTNSSDVSVSCIGVP